MRIAIKKNDQDTRRKRSKRRMPLVKCQAVPEAGKLAGQKIHPLPGWRPGVGNPAKLVLAATVRMPNVVNWMTR